MPLPKRLLDGYANFRSGRYAVEAERYRVLGEGGIGQFRTFAEMGIGFWFAVACAGFTIIGFVFHRRAYKPLHDAWAERLLRRLRSRFGAELVPAKELLNDVIRRRHEVRAIALVADQDPVSAELRHYTTFLGQETAFYRMEDLVFEARSGAIH